MEPCVLGIDLGTSSVKVLLLNASGKVVSQASAQYQVHNPHPGWAETSPQDWWEALCRASRELHFSEKFSIQGIGLSGQMHGLVALSVSGEPLLPAMLWADSRATIETEQYLQLPQEILRSLGNPIFPGMAGPLLLWIKSNLPEVYADIQWVLQPKDWIRYKLTGQIFCEPSDASATLLFDVESQNWSSGLIEHFEFDPNIFPPLLEDSTKIAGVLDIPAAVELGLIAGIPVAAGSADTAASALGSGVFEDGIGQLTIGTGIQLILPHVGSLETKTEPVTHTYTGALAGTWYEMAAMLNGGSSLSWVIDNLASDWEELYKSSEKTPKPDDPVFIPYFYGERTPFLNPTLRAGWYGLTRSTDRESMLYSALEGVAISAALGLRSLSQSAEIGELKLAGGGTTHRPWQQMLANILQVRLLPVEVPSASARGAAILGGLGTGFISVDNTSQEIESSTEGKWVQPDTDLKEFYLARISAFEEIVKEFGAQR